MREPIDRQPLGEDGLVKRKYETPEEGDSKLLLRTTVGIVLANAAILLKNIMFPDQAKAAPPWPSQPLSPSESEQHARADASAGVSTDSFLAAFSAETVAAPAEPEPDPPAFVTAKLFLRSPGTSLAVPRFAPELGQHSAGSLAASNDNLRLYGAAPGTGISSFAEEAAQARTLEAAGARQAPLRAIAGGAVGSADGGPLTGNGRNRADNREPISTAPVMLGLLLSNQAMVIALSELLGKSFDPDGDTLTVTDLAVSSGKLEVRPEGGWIYQPVADDTSDVTFTYTVGDGIATTPQTARLDLVAALDGVIEGTPSGERINGSSGADVIDAGGGDDTVLGDAGNDVIHGGDGDDLILGGAGDDVIHAGAGNDVVFGGAGDDVINGGAGADTLYGEDGDDDLRGDAGDDIVSGGTGQDVLSGGSGDDKVYGDAGDDRLVATAEDGDDIYSGGAGNDTYDASQTSKAIVVDLIAGTAAGADVGDDVLDGIENVIGSGAGDSITGNDAINLLDGGGGDDELIGGAGSDTAVGGAGNDTFVATAADGNDSYKGGAGNDTYRASGTGGGLVVDLGAGTATGIDTGDDELSSIENVVTGAGSDVVTGSADANFVDTGAGDDIVAAGDGDDTIVGAAGQDDLAGNAGNDTFIATAADGNDRIDGGDGQDTYDASTTSADVIADLDSGSVVGAEVGTDFVTAVENVTTGAGDDHVSGDAANNVITTGAGDDVVEAAGGSNVIAAGAGDDVVVQGADTGNDVIDGGDGEDTYDASRTTAAAVIDLERGVATGADVGTDLLVGIENVAGGSGNDEITGNSEANEIAAGAGSDTVDAGGGADTIVAAIGDGNDHYDGGDGVDTYDASTISADTIFDFVSQTASSSDAGTDTIANIENAIGGGGNDTFIAGDEVNAFVGGGGNDVFVFASVANIGKGHGSRDKIMDFDVGDRIDLDNISKEFAEVIDEAFVDHGIRKFVLIGAQVEFSKPGEMRIKYQDFDGAAVTILEGNIDADADTEFELELVGRYELRDEDFVSYR